MFRHLNRERLTSADSGLRVRVDFALAQTVDLQADEPAWVGLIDRVIDDVLDRLTVDPGLNARAARDNSHLVPAIVDEVGVALLNLLLRRQPVRAHRFAVDVASRRQALVGPANLDLRSVHTAGSGFERTPLHRYGTHLGANLDAGIGDRIDRRLEFELEIVKFLQ